jgi:acyl-CoA thioesterase FadM
VQTRAIVFDYLISNAETDTALVTASTTLVSVDATGRPKSMPPGIRALFLAE